MGSFDDLTSNGLSAPPYLLCFVMIIAMTFLSDRLKVRGPIACFFAVVSAVGYTVLATTSTTAPRYIGVYLVVLIFVTVALVLVWNANNNETESKRAGGVWLVCIFDHCCGVYLTDHVLDPNCGPVWYSTWHKSVSRQSKPVLPTKYVDCIRFCVLCGCLLWCSEHLILDGEPTERSDIRQN
jgi:uncharacterized membrane protein